VGKKPPPETFTINRKEGSTKRGVDSKQKESHEKRQRCKKNNPDQVPPNYAASPQPAKPPKRKNGQRIHIEKKKKRTAPKRL